MALCLVMAITIFQSIDPLFSILGVPLLFWIWRRQAAGRGEPGDLAKIGTGAWLAAAGNLVLVGAIGAADGAAIHPLWPFLYCAVQGIAFLYYWPTLLALVSRAARSSRCDRRRGRWRWSDSGDGRREPEIALDRGRPRRLSSI